MNLSELQATLKSCGIVGAGGAGFPAYAKLNGKADTIILNCAECEPLFKVHRQVLAQHTFEILSALEEAAAAVEAGQIIIAVKGAYQDTVAAVEACLPSFPRAKISLLPEVYPAGDEVLTVYEATGRVVPPGDIPLSVGVTVFNVETALNMYAAVQSGAPVTEKYVTVAGAVKRPVTLKVPLGITAGELVEMAGGATVSDPVYLSGGPMTGRIAGAYDVVTKTTNAYLILPKDQQIIAKRTAKPSISLKRAMSACCQCRMCTDLCPRNLLGHPIEPHAFMQAAASGCTENVTPFLNTLYCSQCGVCEMYACFQGLSPRTLIGEYKAGLRKSGVPVSKDVPLLPVRDEREYRQIPVKRLTARLGLTQYDVPAPLDESRTKTKTVKLMMSQHIGAPATPVVKKGEMVQCGQVIGTASDQGLSVPVHASMDGTVADVNEQFIIIRK